jgi:hypothetical protein
VPALPDIPALPVVPAVPVVLSTQVLPEQCCVDVQAWPQLPQFVSLAVVSTHAVPHIVWPPVQPMELQALLLQTWFAGQAFPQLPQFVPSDGTQEPAHSSVPAWHLHWPLWQTWPPRHGIPHPPQFCESAEVSMHPDGQDVCVPGHVGPPLPAEPVVPPVPGVPVVVPGFVHPAITSKANAMPGAKIFVFMPIDIPGGGVSDLPTTGHRKRFFTRFPWVSPLGGGCRDMDRGCTPATPPVFSNRYEEFSKLATRSWP